MSDRETYQKHLAKAADGTPLRVSMNKVSFGTATLDELLAYVHWELWEAIYSLPPSPKDEPRGRPIDADHASCCVLRAECAIRQLERRLKLDEERRQRDASDM